MTRDLTDEARELAANARLTDDDLRRLASQNSRAAAMAIDMREDARIYRCRTCRTLVTFPGGGRARCQCAGQPDAEAIAVGAVATW